MKALVLDGMGVIYSVRDDVKDLLYPFIIEKGGVDDFLLVESLYQATSLGKMSSDKFWKGVGLDPGLEDKYLSRQRLTDGLIDFLKTINSKDVAVWCLSNDISEWSWKLRNRFGLEKFFRGFVVSGDVGIRKPDTAIFEYLIRHLDMGADEIVFVDDQERNLDPAAKLGIETILFEPAGIHPNSVKHRVAQTFNEVLSLLSVT